MQAYTVSGISPAATSLFSWTEAGLKVLHEAFLRCRASHYETNFFNKMIKVGHEADYSWDGLVDGLR